MIVGDRAEIEASVVIWAKSKVEVQEGAREVRVGKSLLLVRALKKLLANLSSTRFIGNFSQGMWQKQESKAILA